MIDIINPNISTASDFQNRKKVVIDALATQRKNNLRSISATLRLLKKHIHLLPIKQGYALNNWVKGLSDEVYYP